MRVRSKEHDPCNRIFRLFENSNLHICAFQLTPLLSLSALTTLFFQTVLRQGAHPDACVPYGSNLTQYKKTKSDLYSNADLAGLGSPFSASVECNVPEGILKLQQMMLISSKLNFSLMLAMCIVYRSMVLSNHIHLYSVGLFSREYLFRIQRQLQLHATNANRDYVPLLCFWRQS